MQRIVAASADIEAQLSVMDGTRPILVMLLLAKREAAGALAQLALCEHDTKIETIRSLQMEVQRFDDLIRWLSAIVEDGMRYDDEITQEERDELADMLIQSPEGEREAMELGLMERRVE
jgi:hypothetical protein